MQCGSALLGGTPVKLVLIGEATIGVVLIRGALHGRPRLVGAGKMRWGRRPRWHMPVSRMR